jgi:hypothetical protein
LERLADSVELFVSVADSVSVGLGEEDREIDSLADFDVEDVPVAVEEPEIDADWLEVSDCDRDSVDERDGVSVSETVGDKDSLALSVRLIEPVGEAERDSEPVVERVSVFEDDFVTESEDDTLEEDDSVTVSLSESVWLLD